MAEPAALAALPPEPAALPAISPGDRVFLVDGSGFIFRAFHALPPLSRPSDGLPTGAVLGFSNMLWKLLADMAAGEAPTHLAVIFDYSSKTFRNEIYDAYKATRSEPPEDLVPQFPLIREAVAAFGVACIEQDGFEADDIIATYACDAHKAGSSVVIVSSDKDMMQLVRPGISMLDTMKNRTIGEAEVAEKFGVEPRLVVDVQALAGDSIDNVPGVPGIGVKTAAELLKEYGSLDALLAAAAGIKQKMRRERLIEFADQARLSRELVRLKADVPLAEGLGHLRVRRPDGAELVGFLRRMEFTTLTRRVAAALKVDAGDLPAAPPPAHARAEARSLAAPSSLGAGTQRAPALLAAKLAAQAKAAPFTPAAYETLTDPARLDGWLAAADEQGALALWPVLSHAIATQAQLIGLGLALGENVAAYVPVGHHGEAGEGALALDAGPAQMPSDALWARLARLLPDPAIQKIGHDLKPLAVLARGRGIALANLDDGLLLAYAVEGGLGGHDLPKLAERLLSAPLPALAEFTGAGRKRIGFAAVSPAEATRYAAAHADAALRIWRVLRARAVGDGLLTVYETLERPLIGPLADMEREGIAIDRTVLARLSATFAAELETIEAEIYALAGTRFNIGSPKQMAELLFGTLGLAGGRKTMTGAFSTGARILEDLIEDESLTDDQRRLPKRLLEWRQLSKLKSTYTDSLPGDIHTDTGRIHSTFAQCATNTGRLSSSDPNLQNIPIRTAQGRQIRAAFVAAPGMALIAADYSQIELRILAHIADIPELRQAFSDGVDIHAMTAAEMFGVPVAGMPADVRRRAKAINFGIIYGISAFGLAQQLSIGRGEAQDTITRYFQRFPGIRDYMEEMRAQVRAHGHVETLFGRRIHFADIKTPNRAMRAFYERAAINAPIQGSAADIIRRAMVRLPTVLAAAGVPARMMLQVHDELLFEAPTEAAEAALPIIARTMEQAALPAVLLAVPLAVDARAAANWHDAH